jgi:hypothetical protein
MPTFSAVDVQRVYVIGNDLNLWLEFGNPFGNVPPSRQQASSNVAVCAAVDATTIYVSSGLPDPRTRRQRRDRVLGEGPEQRLCDRHR